MPTTLQLKGTITGIPGGSINIGPYDAINNADNVQTTIQITLANGDNTIPVPSGNIEGVIIIVDGARTKTIRTVVGDTGIAIKPNGWNVIAFDPLNTPVSIIINKSFGPGSDKATLMFF